MKKILAIIGAFALVGLMAPTAQATTQGALSNSSKKLVNVKAQIGTHNFSIKIKASTTRVSAATPKYLTLNTFPISSAVVGDTTTVVVIPPIVIPPIVIPPIVIPPIVIPPIVIPPIVTPPIVTPPIVTPPIVTPPIVTPPIVTHVNDDNENESEAEESDD